MCFSFFCCLLVVASAQLDLVSTNTAMSPWRRVAASEWAVVQARLHELAPGCAVSEADERSVQLSVDGGHTAAQYATARGLRTVSFGTQLRFRGVCAGGLRWDLLAMRDKSHHYGLLQRRSAAPPSPLASVRAALRVVCFNLFNFNAPWPERLALIVQRIVAARADVVLLQELRFSSRWRHPTLRSKFQIAHLLAALPGDWQFVHAPAMFYPAAESDSDDFEFEGVAILSRLPIIATDTLALSRNLRDAGDEPHQRVVLRARLGTADGGAIDFFTTHFSLSETAQLRAVHELLRWLRALAATDPAVPQILGGDLNALPSAASIRSLVGELSDGDFHDAWLTHLRSAPAAADAARLDAQFGATFPTLGAKPFKRIDYVLVRNVAALAVPEFSVVPDDGDRDRLYSVFKGAPDGSLVAEAKRSTVWASDHLALVVQLQLEPQRDRDEKKDEL